MDEQTTDRMGAVQLTWEDGSTSYVILPIHEFRNDGARFRLWDPSQNGSHLLRAGEIRRNWNAWVAELVSDEQIVDEPPAGMSVY